MKLIYFFTNIDVPHTSAVLYGSHMCGHGGELEVWVPQYLVKTYGCAIVYHPAVIWFVSQEKMGEAEDFFPAADIILPWFTSVPFIFPYLQLFVYWLFIVV